MASSEWKISSDGSFPKTHTGDILEAFHNYQAWLHVQPLSKHTKRNYTCQVLQFLTYLERSNTTTQLLPLSQQSSRKIVFEYKQFRNSMRVRDSSINTSFVAIHSFLKFMGIGAVTFDRERIAPAEPKLLTRDQISQLEIVLDSTRSAKEVAVVSLFMYVGILPSECVNLNLTDLIVGDESMELVIRSDHENDGENLKLPPPAKAAVSAWLTKRQQIQTADVALFVNRAGTRISTSGLNLIVRKIGIRAGIGLSGRVLRQTCFARKRLEYLRNHF